MRYPGPLYRHWVHDGVKTPSWGYSTGAGTGQEICAFAALNVIVAMNFSVVAWGSFMSIYAIVSNAAFLIAYATMRCIGVCRRRAHMIPALP